MSDKSDDRMLNGQDGKAKPLATVRLDLGLMNELTASKGSDNDSLGELMIRHRGLVWNELRRWNIRRCDVDDVAGNVWNKVWSMGRDGTWNADRARYVRDPFMPLLKKICKSKAMDFHRGVKRERTRQDRLLSAVEHHGGDWRETVAAQQRQRSRPQRPQPAGVPEQLMAAVAALPERLRKPYELHASGLTNRKIADTVCCSWGEVSRRLKEARTILGLTAASPAR